MVSPRACPACHTRASRPAGHASGFALERCRTCKSLFTARLPTTGEAQDYETYYHAGNLEVPDFVHDRLGEIVSTFEPYRRINRWLDVGFGAGTLMRAAARHGWEVAGTEVAPGAEDTLRAEGFEVHLGDVAELGLPAQSFDVVSMVEVLEHVSDPDVLLAAAVELLRSGGALYVTTPHARGVSARLLGTRWSVVAPPEHLQLFSVRGLRAALTRRGLIERTLETRAVDPTELLQAFRRQQGAAQPVSRVETSYRLNESLSSRPLGMLVKRVANATLSATRLGDAITLVAVTSPRGGGRPRA